MAKTDEYIVISYWPLIDISKPVIFDNPAVDMPKFLENTPQIDIISCIWVMDDGKPIPVLITDRAKDIRNHMLEWCDQDPVPWFRLSIKETENNGYVLIIYPDIMNSIKRFKLTCFLTHGFVPPETAKFQIIFSPIRFFCASNQTYLGIKSLLGDRIKVGFLDAKDVNPNKPDNTDFSKVEYIEGIKRIANPDSSVVHLMDELITNNQGRSDVFDTK